MPASALFRQCLCPAFRDSRFERDWLLLLLRPWCVGRQHQLPHPRRRENDGDGELWDESVRLTEITRRLKAEAGNATHFVVLDACRNTLKLTNPGSRAVVQSKGFAFNSRPVPGRTCRMMVSREWMARCW
jgi:hypothetical protein